MNVKKLEYLLLYHCAPTLYKKKAAGMFSLSGTEKISLPFITDTYLRLVNPLDLKITFLCNCKKRVLVYVYNENLLTDILNAPPTLDFLKKYGYENCKNTDDYINFLKTRIANSENFPHEIGIFLGYPLYDVQKFISTGGRNFIYSGDWKVYHDKSGAIKKFNSYKKCRYDICQKLNSGLTADEILYQQTISQPRQISRCATVSA